MPFRFQSFPSVYTDLLLLVRAWSCTYMARGAEDYHRVVTIFSISVVGVLFLGRGTVCYVLRLLRRAFRRVCDSLNVGVDGSGPQMGTAHISRATEARSRPGQSVYCIRRLSCG
uniref:ABC transporter permease protein n=1 Tax=Endocarpon pusillum TaxID=364733 RepID=F8QX15_9EURO|nr:ABC transporter permease protein [Endocarpon pusillum]